MEMEGKAAAFSCLDMGKIVFLSSPSNDGEAQGGPKEGGEGASARL